MIMEKEVSDALKRINDVHAAHLKEEMQTSADCQVCVQLGLVGDK
nr:hypothetical protein [Ferrimicrobium acidiphilum]